ncbi:MAG: (2Fe-2S) ferredoxin domain-containing protein [Proteobacteria bacterium]|nr:(2Fe-2S) ferredoxin domain-containing protein [Pseudomonadota bacterium]
MSTTPSPKRVLLLTRTATSVVPLGELARLRASAASLPGVSDAAFAFSEEGTPSLRAVLMDWAADDMPILIVPLIVPADPAFENWLKRTVARWQAEQGGTWPPIGLAPFPGNPELMTMLVAGLITSSAITPVEGAKAAGMDGSVVPAQKRRVLVCMGGPCNSVGASVIWGHLRNEQKRLSLRTAGEGMMSAKTSCLGPCSLAPVVQVWPEGTLYGGVDEAGIDRIVATHLLGGEIVEELAYAATGVKQRLR